MGIEDNKALVRQFIEEVMNTGNVDAIAEYCVPGSLLAGGLAGQFKVMKLAFPDLNFTIDEMVAEDNNVVALLTQRGTNSGPLAGFPAFGKFETPVPPTGEPVMASLIYVFRIRDGKIASLESEFDQVGVLRQIGWTFSPPGRA